jgi:hypothetical protein
MKIQAQMLPIPAIGHPDERKAINNDDEPNEACQDLCQQARL